MDTLSYISFQPMLKTGVKKKRLWYMPFCQWDGAYKIYFIAKQSSLHSGHSRFPLSSYLSGSLPYVRHHISVNKGARCSSVVRAFAHGAMGRRIDHSWVEPIELFLVPASAPRLV